jgi:hypothetical protein
MKVRTRWMCHLSALLLCTFLFGPVVYMLADRDPPFAFIRGEIVPDNPSPGESISVIWYANITRRCDGIVHRRIIDSHGVIFNFTSVPALYRYSPDIAKFARTFPLPAGIAQGWAEYAPDVFYWCNPLQKLWPIHGKAPALKFFVTPGVSLQGEPGPEGQRGLTGPEGPRGPQGNSQQ